MNGVSGEEHEGGPRARLRAGELDAMREMVLAMGELVDQAITRAMRALEARDVELAGAVVDGDERVNELQRRLRELCFQAILTRPPVAADLRELLSFLHMAAELERMGDHCVSVAKIARGLVNVPAGAPSDDLREMGARCSEQVRAILSALMARDVERAREVARRDDRIDRLYHRLFDDLVGPLSGLSEDAYRVASQLFVAHHWERIGDRVTNLAEDLVFLETGEVTDLD